MDALHSTRIEPNSTYQPRTKTQWKGQKLKIKGFKKQKHINDPKIRLHIFYSFIVKYVKVFRQKSDQSCCILVTSW